MRSLPYLLAVVVLAATRAAAQRAPAASDPVCPGEDVVAVFQPENLGQTDELFAGVPPIDPAAFPPATLVFPAGEQKLYAALVSRLPESGLQGWSISFDVRGPVELLDARTEGTEGEVGVGPDMRLVGFNLTQLVSQPAVGISRGVWSTVVLHFKKPVTLPPTGTSTVLEVTLEGSAGESADLLWYDDAFRLRDEVAPGAPEGGGATGGLIHESVGIVRGENVDICEVSARVRFEPSAGDFIRGDANDDGAADISDALWILHDLFGSGVTRCIAAADANGDLRKDISDAIYLLGFLFLGGRPPPAPFPECGGRDLLDDPARCLAGTTRCSAE